MKSNPSNDLEQTTRGYWLLSSTYNGRNQTQSLTIGNALSKATDLSNNLGPHRPLKKHVEALRHDMIMHGGTAKRSKKEAIQK